MTPFHSPLLCGIIAFISAPVYGLVAQKDLSKVSEYLDRIKATPAERAFYANSVVAARIGMIAPNGRVTLDDLNDLIGWASDNAPDAVGSVTGRFLATVSIRQGQMTFAEAAASAVAYHDASPNDDIFVEFLRNSDSSSAPNRLLARDIVNRISDEGRRTAIIEDLE